MWHLSSENDPRVLYVVSETKEVIVGRSPDTQICNFAILDDASISRKHAAFKLSGNALYVEDLGSRYGTFVNDLTAKLDANNLVQLNDGDIVKLGKMNSVWCVRQTNLVTCTSTLKGENLQNLRSVIANIGGVIKNEWDETCTYLTMPAITLTIKVVLALVQGSHIVTTEFWKKCSEAVSKNAVLPNPSDFVPQVIESTLNKEVVSFLPDERRKLLFNGKKIIFFSKRQHEMYKTVLLKSSAVPLLLSDSKMSKSMLCEDNTIMIQYNSSTSQETESQKNQINEVVNYLKSKGKRVVADAEIGLAILYCSTNKYCNPDFNFPSEVVKQTSGQDSTPGNVLAQDTQEISKQKGDNVVINESLVSNNNENVLHEKEITAKRKLSEVDEDLQTNASKKIATSAITSSEIGKRKLNNDNEETNPSKRMALENEYDPDGLFNFIAPNNSKDNTKTTGADKLNLSKPQKRKADVDADEDDIFNFIQKPKISNKDTDENILEKTQQIDAISIKKNLNKTSEPDISAMRGSKLQELMQSDANWITNDFQCKVKKEINDDLDEKMNLLYLGSVTVTINKNLIVKKEPVQVEEQSSSQIKNFKKFKKVWPVKMQVTIIPKSSTSTIDSSVLDDKSSTSNIDN